MSKAVVKWKPLTKSPLILQIYSKGLEYALVSNEMEQCHNFIWCKDFLHDVYHSSINKKPIIIYNFRYNPEINPRPCEDKIRLLLTNPKDKKFSKKMPACLDFINQIEERLKIKKTIGRECENPPEPYQTSGVWIFEGSKRWIKAPPMISLYSLLIRAGLSHTQGQPALLTIQGIKEGKIKPFQRNDRTYLNNSELGLDKIFHLGDRKIFSRKIQDNYPGKLAIDTVHNRLGIIGFSADILCDTLGQSVIVPHWHSKK